MSEPLLLALDQGTTSTRAILFDARGQPLATAGRPLAQSYPQDGWVEHDPEEIFESSVAVLREASAGRLAEVAALGITNQRETVVVWDRETGRPVAPAIVWQDRRTADVCERLRGEGVEARVTEVSGLLLDPYFSGTKLAWLLDHVEGARAAAEAGRLLAGTIDTWVIWRLTCGRVHATDATNASRTLLFDIETQAWSAEMGALLNVPLGLLAEVRDCAGDFGETDAQWLGRAVPIRGVAGDQQAALMGQGCIRPGEMKATYGTGCFLLLHTGERRPRSTARLLSTVAARVGGITTYALEGSIFTRARRSVGERGAERRGRSHRRGGARGAGSARSWRDVGARVHGPGRALVEGGGAGAMFGLTRDTACPRLRRPRSIRRLGRPTTSSTPCVGTRPRRSARRLCCASTAACPGRRGSRAVGGPDRPASRPRPLSGDHRARRRAFRGCGRRRLRLRRGSRPRPPGGGRTRARASARPAGSRPGALAGGGRPSHRLTLAPAGRTLP
jgi:glycerol kinase